MCPAAGSRLKTHRYRGDLSKRCIVLMQTEKIYIKGHSCNISPSSPRLRSSFYLYLYNCIYILYLPAYKVHQDAFVPCSPCLCHRCHCLCYPCSGWWRSQLSSPQDPIPQLHRSYQSVQSHFCWRYKVRGRDKIHWQIRSNSVYK